MKPQHKLTKHLSQPWFDLVASGQKTVEGRLCLPYYTDLQPGDCILFHNEDDNTHREVLARMVSALRYPSFHDMLTSEGLPAVLPSPAVQSVEQGVAVYRQFYSEAEEQECGVIAIRISVLP